jgi:hypothetical protein
MHDILIFHHYSHHLSILKLLNHGNDNRSGNIGTILDIRLLLPLGGMVEEEGPPVSFLLYKVAREL